MSAGVFPPTSSRSTRPRTSYAHAGVRGLCGLHEGAVSQRIGPGISATAAGPAGSHRWFPGGRGSFSPRGSPGGWVPPERRAGRVPDGRPDRPGANDALACPGTSCPPRAQPCVPRAGPCFFPEPTLLCFKPTLLLARAHPLRACSSAVLGSLLRSPRLSSFSSALPRMRPGRPKTGVRLRRTWRVTGNTGLTYEV